MSQVPPAAADETWETLSTIRLAPTALVPQPLAVLGMGIVMSIGCGAPSFSSSSPGLISVRCLLINTARVSG